MPRLRGARLDVGSPNFMLSAAALVALVLAASGLLSSFHFGCKYLQPRSASVQTTD